MINKNFRLFILFALFSTSGVFAFADEPSSSLDDKPSVDTATAADTQASYLYDLKKLIEKSRANIKEVNQKIKEQTVLKRNQKREERARAYYEKGVELTNEGKLDEARDYFEKAIRITEHPEMAGYIKQSQRRLRKQEAALQAQERQHHNQIKKDESVRKQDVEAAYKEAVDLYKQKKYHPAKDAFEHVDEIAPDYRATGSYLKIIDQDIITGDALAAKQQAVEIAHQQKEAEAARVKEKAMWLAQIAEKEKERKDAVNKQAGEVYGQAVVLYKNKKFAEAKKKFEEVSWVIPDYKATIKYLGRIDKDAQVEGERAALQQQKALQEQRWEEEVQLKKQEAQRQYELKAKERQHVVDLQEQAQFLYTAAVNLFNKKNMDEALGKFNEIEKLFPNFKSTRVYVARIEQWKIDHQKQLLESQKRSQGEDLRQKKIADQRQRAQELKDKNDQAENIYVKALNLYRDHQWEESKVQFESVENRFPNFKHTRRYLQKIEIFIARKAKVKPAVVIKAPAPAVKIPVTQPLQPPGVGVVSEDQQKQAQDIAALVEKSAQLYRQIADIADDRSTAQTKRKMAQVERLLRQELKAKQEERRAEAKKMYREALEYLRSHDYAKAKVKFLALENIIPDYKATRRYLSRIEKDQKRANIEAVITREQKEEGRLKQLQDEARQRLEQQQQAALQNLAQKASAINDNIIRLSAGQDYEAMKAKFTELENTVTALATLKGAMGKQKEKRLPSKVQSTVPPAISPKQVREQARQSQAQLEARREAVRKQLEDGVEAMYQKAMSLYQQGNYTAAADKFKDVQDILPGYKRSEQYMGEARRKSFNPPPVITPVSPSVSRQNSVSQALDLFDSNVQ